MTFGSLVPFRVLVVTTECEGTFGGGLTTGPDDTIGVEFRCVGVGFERTAVGRADCLTGTKFTPLFRTSCLVLAEKLPSVITKCLC